MSLDGHDIQEENVGAYLLGALEESEAERFERHVESCPLCRDELDRLRPAAEALPRSVISVQAPSSLRAAIMREVEKDLAERGEVAVDPRPGLLRRTLGRARNWLQPGSGAVAGVRPGVAWVSVAVVLVVGVLAGFGVFQATSGGEAQARTLSATVDKRELPAASGSLVVPASMENGGVLRVHGMESLDSQTVYEVWVQRDGETIAQSLFGVGSDGDGAAAVADDLRGADAVLVTREPTGGSKAPSERAVLKVAL